MDTSQARMSVKWMRQGPLRQRLFRIGVLIKGIDGALELVAGIGAWLINPVVIVRMIALLTQDETADNGRDLVIHFLRHEAQRLLFVSKHFLAIYLLGHGIAKLFVVGALIRNRLWAYPVALFVFGLFIAYEAYRSVATHGIGLIVLTTFDVIVAILIWMEYRAQKS